MTEILFPTIIEEPAYFRVENIGYLILYFMVESFDVLDGIERYCIVLY